MVNGRWVMEDGMFAAPGSRFGAKRRAGQFLTTKPGRTRRLALTVAAEDRDAKRGKIATEDAAWSLPYTAGIATGDTTWSLRHTTGDYQEG
jgi:hypothetical protein